MGKRYGVGIPAELAKIKQDKNNPARRWLPKRIPGVIFPGVLRSATGHDCFLGAIAAIHSLIFLSLYETTLPF
ncbi:MAG: hypothetical protein HC849_17030 [Oscillatoriales cyanobacterium RU_3_3]|nr:hypothetical protein [Oscillatoriales cyanobacterium RU_3_3]NJR22677.1 hypothetical protein [Richelia sp. CSU_2_1]